MPTISHEKIEELLRTFFAGLLSEAEDVVFFAKGDDKLDIDAEIEGLEQQRENLKKRLMDWPPDQSTANQAQELLATLSPEGQQPDAFEKLCDGVLRARIEQSRIWSAMLRGAYDEAEPRDLLFKGVKSLGLPPLPGEPVLLQKDTLGDLVEKYCDQKTGTNWTPKTSYENRRVLSWFVTGVGIDRAIGSVTQDEVRRFRDDLQKLPKHFTTDKEYKGLSIAEVAALSDGQKLLSGQTLNKYFGCVKWFFEWCLTEGFLESSPVGKLKIGTKAGGYDQREPYTVGELNAIFQCPQYTGHKSEGRRMEPGDVIVRDGKFWIPLLGLFTGMRLGEIAQLLVSDIRDENGIFYFDVNKDDAGGKSLKTKASQRKIPIHSTLIDVGFLKHVEKQRLKGSNSRLFPDIKPGANGSYSHNFSKYYARFLKQVGIKKDELVFHSYRHTFTDALRMAQIEDSRIKALLGHSDQSVTAHYGAGVPLKVLAQDMVRVEYDGLDLSHLIGSGH